MFFICTLKPTIMRTKILLPFTILFFIAVTSNAQITEGKILLGGSVSYYNATNGGSNSLYTNAQVGKAIKNNTIMGLDLSYTSNDYSGSISRQTGYGAGIFYRKYKSLGKEFYFFAEFNGNYRYSKNVLQYFRNINQSLNTTSGGVAIEFVPGLSYFLTKGIQIELSMPNVANISYSHIKTINSDLPMGIASQKTDVFSANAILNSNLLYNFGMGFKFLLGK